MSKVNEGSLPKAIIYTDGACDPNPGPGGWAALLLLHEGRKEIHGWEASTTNNRMELMAAIQALKSLPGPHVVEIYTDSRYLQLGIQDWLPNWVKRGWRRKGGRLANIELWQELYQATQVHVIEWHWVRGHFGDPLNERVNRLAQGAIRRG